MLGVFYCSEKGQAIPQGCSSGRRRQGCRGSRNEMLSPGKGITWPWHGLGTDFRHPQTNIIFFPYIPQFLPRELRAFFIQHISILFPDIIQKNTWFSLRACLPLCGCWTIPCVLIMRIMTCFLTGRRFFHGRFGGHIGKPAPKEAVGQSVMVCAGGIYKPHETGYFRL